MFPDIFKDGLGKLKGVEAKLYIDKESIPRCFKPRSVPFALRAKVDNEPQRLEANGVLVPIEHSDWAAPIVPILKTNGEVRICGDYKLTVNKAAKVDQYPIPNIDDLYSKLSEGVAYSKHDLSHAYEQICPSKPDLSHTYEQICLSSDSQHLTTITTLKGLFASLLRGIVGTRYLPESHGTDHPRPTYGCSLHRRHIGIGTNVQEARANLVTVIQRLQTAGLRLRLEKCTFMQKSCMYISWTPIGRWGNSPHKRETVGIAASANSNMRYWVTWLRRSRELLSEVPQECERCTETTVWATTVRHFLTLGVSSATCIRSIKIITTIVESASSLQL